MEQDQSDFAMVNRAVPQKGARELKVEDALLYLDQVKVEFSDQPKIYNEFLEIMKNFKAQSITTPGVIDQVKQLFRGHNKLILGFNTFLPEGEGFKIELSPEEEAYPQLLQQQHAISYVTNIRTRFASEPEIYKAFLKILHTYQREQKGIKDVLDQVSALFADHPDLLMDFTYFLPDAVQDQAKERLRAAVNEIESKKKQSHKRRADGYRNERETKSAKSSQNMDIYSSINSNQINQKKSARTKKSEMSQQYDRDDREKVNSFSHMYHTITTERKFFDQVKELLTSSSRDAWTEFVKCLDLLSHDALSKREVLILAQELFGPGNEDLLDEFKSLLSSRQAYDSSKQDMWYSIPLTEIDFSQCRRCTPSYRILPSDYPKRICSGGKGLKESSLLNEEWVSIPIGSEESFAFKQMRKNQYEEAIFRSEDERFEVDMVIDSNCTCIRVLEAMAEEFSRLKFSDESQKFGIEFVNSSLGVIHLNVISRLYGEHGPDILDALRRNPVGTIPVILKRLKQKDVEWRDARHKMQIQWKDILMKNYDKSLDHRSYIFKPQDKRSYTTRFLVNDIKDATTVDVKEGRVPQVSYTTSPEILALSKGMQPQLYLTYTSSDRIALLDVDHLLSYAAETSQCSSIEKERMSALWRDLFRVILNMPVHYFFSPSSVDKLHIHYTAQLRKKGHVEEHEEPERRTLRNHHHHHQHQHHQQQSSHAFWPIGTRVVTIYGVGNVTGLDKETGIHEVTLTYGKGYFPLATIVGAESLSNNALEAIGVSRSESGKDSILEVNVTNDPPEERVFAPSCLLYGTQMCYIFLRLHHTLTLRLAEARQFASEFGKKKKKSGSRYLSTLSNATDIEDIDDDIDLIALGENPSSRGRNHSTGSVYGAYLSQLYSFIDGSIDATRYEDNTRNILGGHAYALSSIDKIVQQCIKCLQALSSDDITHRLVGIFLYHNFSPQYLQHGVSPTLYRDHVANCLKNTLEDVYRLQFISPCQTGDMVVACQYLGVLPLNNSTSSTSSTQPDSVQKAPKLVLADDDEDDALTADIQPYRLELEPPLPSEEEESEGDSIQLENNSSSTFVKDGRKLQSTSTTLTRRRRSLERERDDDIPIDSSSTVSLLERDDDLMSSGAVNSAHLFDNILQAAANDANENNKIKSTTTRGGSGGGAPVVVKEEPTTTTTTTTTTSKSRASNTRSSRKK